MRIYCILLIIILIVPQEDGELMPLDADGKVAYSNVDYVNTWPELEKCVGLGLARSIGLSNFNSEQIDRVLQVAKIKPVMNQVGFFLLFVFIYLFIFIIFFIFILFFLELTVFLNINPAN